MARSTDEPPRITRAFPAPVSVKEICVVVGLEGDSIAQCSCETVEELHRKTQRRSQTSTGGERRAEAGHTSKHEWDTSDPGGYGAVHIGLHGEVLSEIGLETAVDADEFEERSDLKERVQASSVEIPWNELNPHALDGRYESARWSDCVHLNAGIQELAHDGRTKTVDVGIRIGDDCHRGWEVVSHFCESL